MAVLRQLAPLKLNLFLHLIGRRHDGYHLLESLFVFGDDGDELEYELHDQPFNLQVTGPYAADTPSDGRNLVVQAAQLLSPSGTGTLHLTKKVPVASGIGGGSADAAAALKLLNQAWGLNRSDTELHDLGLRLGADIPACLLGQPCYVSGIGEQLIPVENIRTIGYVVVNPNQPLATATVFRARAESATTFRSPLQPWPPERLEFTALHNDLEASARTLLPVIDELIAALLRSPGSMFTRMSGSGASCFGLFATEQEARDAADQLGVDHPGWWVTSGSLKIPAQLY